MKYLIVGIVVIAGGTGVWFLSSGEKKSTNDNLTQNEQVSMNQVQEPAEDSFANFIAKGGAHVCTVEQQVAGMVTSGKVYIGNGKIKGLFSSVVSGMPIDTSVIVRDGVTYTWTSMSSFGFKASSLATSSAVDANTTSTSGTYAWNAQDIGSYNCTPWTMDESVFTVPSNIEFLEPGDMGRLLNR